MITLYVLAVLIVLAVFLRRGTRAQQAVRLDVALDAVEGAEPVAMANWPATVRAELSRLLVREQMRRSADYRQGMHTSVEAREAGYALQEHIGLALNRMREAGRISA
ncbi:hypothetical protein ACH9D2_18805 [Kocuria sp. M4R2S49]|uniref:hypothetical protein n=1 Tax=Kocuria rhizosphaericola TaxID=3376284 RepID=UPI00378E9138